MIEQFFRIMVPDHAAPSFITAQKPCYGTRDDIYYFAFLNNKDWEPDIAGYPAELLYTEETVLYNHEWQHTNIWDCTYRMKCQNVITRHFWLKDVDKYVRCTKARFYKLMYVGATGQWENVGEQIWGYPNLIEPLWERDSKEPVMHVSTLSEVEKYFDTLDEVKADHEQFKNTPDPIFTEFCNDIFADG